MYTKSYSGSYYVYRVGSFLTTEDHIQVLTGYGPLPLTSVFFRLVLSCCPPDSTLPFLVLCFSRSLFKLLNTHSRLL